MSVRTRERGRLARISACAAHLSLLAFVQINQHRHVQVVFLIL